jgi:serine/threonine-protein phosphatase 6 catalytic subunit
MPLDVDACIESLKGGEIVPESSLKFLCQYVSELLMEESNVQPVLSPVTIVGDLHGQVFDLLNLLNVGGWPPTTSYIFLVRRRNSLSYCAGNSHDWHRAICSRVTAVTA